MPIEALSSFETVITSVDIPLRILPHKGHTPHGRGNLTSFLFLHERAAAASVASVCFPVPFGPSIIYACDAVPFSMDLPSESFILSFPKSCLKISLIVFDYSAEISIRIGVSSSISTVAIGSVASPSDDSVSVVT